MSRAAAAELAPFLEGLFTRYHRPEFLGSDPLAMVRAFDAPADRETAAVFAALLAYGAVKQINASLARLFAAMEPEGPAAFVAAFQPDAGADATVPGPARLAGFRHRFTDGEDIAALCWLLRAAGPLELFFAACMDPAEPDLTGAMSRFVTNLTAVPAHPRFDIPRIVAKRSFKHLLPQAARGSACKRLHMLLRWLARPDDGIDLGLWTTIHVAKLLVPVDTHVLRIASNLGLLPPRATADARAARIITAALRLADPHDPVRFDFALCRMGILKACPAASRLTACDGCGLRAPCRARRRLQRAAARISLTA